MSLLQVRRLSKAYASAVIVKDFDLEVNEGEFVSLLGHSGCGKSTVLSVLAGLNRQTSGTMILAERELKGPGLDRGVVFQAPCLLPWLTALGNVQLAVDQANPSLRHRDRVELARGYLELVGLGDSLHVRPDELSGGMRQRVGIARAFGLSPRMLLLDEPFGMLDSLTRWELQEILLGLCERTGKTAIMVTHDVDEALFLSSRVVLMTNGPAARVGEIVDVRWPRPRERRAVLSHPDYYALRERLVGFLEKQGQPSPTDPTRAISAPEESTARGRSKETEDAHTPEKDAQAA